MFPAIPYHDPYLLETRKGLRERGLSHMSVSTVSQQQLDLLFCLGFTPGLPSAVWLIQTHPAAFTHFVFTHPDNIQNAERCDSVQLPISVHTYSFPHIDYARRLSVLEMKWICFLWILMCRIQIRHCYCGYCGHFAGRLGWTPN